MSVPNMNSTCRGGALLPRISWQQCWDALWYAVLPDWCVGCRAPLSTHRVPFWCEACWGSLIPLRGPQCPRCGIPFSSPMTLIHSPAYQCQTCRMSKPAYERALSLYPYASPLREAIHRFKYGRTLAMGRVLAQLMIQALPESIEVDIVVPVPLAPARLREREYNQSLILALEVARALRRPVADSVLWRQREGTPQTALPRRARLRNLRRAFTVIDTAPIREKRILLIDDVLTTGTTLNECAKALRKAGSGPVTALTLARTLA